MLVVEYVEVQDICGYELGNKLFDNRFCVFGRLEVYSELGNFMFKRFELRLIF